MKKCKLKKILSLLSAAIIMMGMMHSPLPAAAQGSNAREILESIQAKAPTLSEDGSRLILPTIQNSDYEVFLHGSSNQAVIGMDGTVHRPLTDMTVTVSYRVTSKSNPEDTATNPYKEAVIVIPGKYQQQADDNPKPDVVPQIREWKGAQGDFYLSDHSRLVLSDERLEESAEVIAEYFKEMLGRDIQIVVDQPLTGDIYLCLTEQSELGNEGYAIEIGDIVTVTAPTDTGILYAGTTLTQILYQDQAHQKLPRGIMRDYPEYEVRSCMIDVARMYIPLDYLEEITRYMAYFKLNEIHVHVNDNGGEQEYAFRLESKKYPEINSNLPADQIYTQEDYKRYQTEMQKYGIDVITEIDTPAHSGFVNLYDKSLMLDSSHIDVRKPAAITFVKSLLDEYLDGDDPVVKSKKFHIGTDEYPAEYAEAARAYMDELIDYVNQKGYDTRMWGSLGGAYGLDGNTEVSTNAVAHYWSSAYSSFTEMLDAGYPCINNWGLLLYVVPGLINDHLNVASIYDAWEVNELEGGLTVAKSSPLMMGAEASLWHDIKVGSSEHDIFDRFRDQIVLMAEKNWYGDRDENSTGADFLARVAKVDHYAPGSNPAAYVPSATEVIASYDFETVESGLAADVSRNGYRATVNNLSVISEGDNHVLELNGQGDLSLPFSAVGFPYTVSFDLFLDGPQKENATLLAGKSGTVYLNYQNTGLIGYERNGYAFVFHCEPVQNAWQNITITCDEFCARLYIDGIYAATGTYYNVEADKENSSTLVLPTVSIGAGVVGKIDDLVILNRCRTYAEMIGYERLDYRNLAQGQRVSVSALEVNDGRFSAEMAVDGDPTTRVSLEPKDDAWLVLDLGRTYLADVIELEWNEQAEQYEILISADGENWTLIKQNADGQGGASLTETIVLTEKQSIRYVKYRQIKMWTNGSHSYSGNFTELRVYGFGTDITAILKEAGQALSATAVTKENKALVDRISACIGLMEQMLPRLGVEELVPAIGGLSEQVSLLKENEAAYTAVNVSRLIALLRDRIDASCYKPKEIAQYLHAYRNGIAVLYDVNATQREIDLAAANIEQALLKLGPSNLALGKPVTSATGTPSVITNGSLDDFWDGGNYPADFVIDLGGEYAISKFVAYPFVGQGRGYKYEIYVSTDGESYVSAAQKKKASKETNDGTEFELESPVLARYVKVVMTYNNVNSAVHMREFEVYGVVTTLETVNKTALEAAIAQAQELDTALYTQESVVALLQALEAAKYGDYSTQASIDALTDALKDAIDGLTFPESSTDRETSAATDDSTDTGSMQNGKDPDRHGCKSALTSALWTTLLVLTGVCPIVRSCKKSKK